MDKTITEEIKTTRIKHVFTCDRCGIELGTSIEHDDGYYESHNDYSLYHVAHTILSQIPDDEINLCDGCYKRFLQEFQTDLCNLIDKYKNHCKHNDSD